MFIFSIRRHRTNKNKKTSIGNSRNSRLNSKKKNYSKKYRGQGKIR